MINTILNLIGLFETMNMRCTYVIFLVREEAQGKTLLSQRQCMLLHHRKYFQHYQPELISFILENPWSVWNWNSLWPCLSAATTLLCYYLTKDLYSDFYFLMSTIYHTFIILHCKQIRLQSTIYIRRKEIDRKDLKDHLFLLIFLNRAHHTFLSLL